MNLETATVKPEANFPAAHPYWAGLLFGGVTVPVFIALSKPLAQQWGALLLAMIVGPMSASPRATAGPARTSSSWHSPPSRWQASSSIRY